MKTTLKLILFITVLSSINIAGVELYQFFNRKTFVPIGAVMTAIENVSTITFVQENNKIDTSLGIQIAKLERHLHRVISKRKTWKLKIKKASTPRLIITRASKNFNFEKIKDTRNPKFETQNKIEGNQDYSINNDELVFLKKIKIEIGKLSDGKLLQAFKKFDLISKLNELEKNDHSEKQKLIANKKEEASVKDEVKLVQSATIDINSEEDLNEIVNNVDLSVLDKKSDSNESDELVFLDYPEINEEKKEESTTDFNLLVGEERPTSQLEVVGNQISSVVRAAIKRESEKGRRVSEQPTSQIIRKAGVNVLSATSHSGIVKPTPEAKDVVALAASGFQKGDLFGKDDEVDEEQLISSNIITVNQINIDKGIDEKIAGYELIDGANRNKRTSDEGTGEVSLLMNIQKNNGGNYVGAIFKAGAIATNFTVELEAGEYINEIPVFDRYEMNGFLDKEIINDLGGYLLIDLDDKIDSVDIDRNHSAKIYLDKKYRVVDISEDYRYILYVGVPAGNIMISYLNLKDELIEKITLIRESELTFERSETQRRRKITYNIYETMLLGSRKNELDIQGRGIKVFNRSITSKKVGINRYELIFPTSIKKTRRYLELNHLKETVFVGVGNNREIEVPSTEYIEHVMGEFELDELNNSCIVQVNLTDKTLTFEVEAEDKSGPTNYDLRFLGSDGEFSNEPTPLSEKAFIMSSGQGMFQVKIGYESGANQYLSTICSDDTYLVEQL